MKARWPGDGTKQSSCHPNHSVSFGGMNADAPMNDSVTTSGNLGNSDLAI